MRVNHADQLQSRKKAIFTWVQMLPPTSHSDSLSMA
jgi:hypothetical protein